MLGPIQTGTDSRTNRPWEEISAKEVDLKHEILTLPHGEMKVQNF